MSILFSDTDPPVEFVLHPTDLSRASLVAFHHALALAIHRGARFTLLHAGRSSDAWSDFPSVRRTLTKWRQAGTTLGLEEKIRQSMVSRVEVAGRGPVAASREYIERHAVDMIVLATQGRTGLSRLLRPSQAERLARESRLFTLFVPDGARPFVSGETGAIELRHIIIPIEPTTDPRPAMLRAVRSASLLGDSGLEITLLHVGDGEDLVTTDVPDLPYCRWNAIQRSGDITEAILDVAEGTAADAIYMSTSWNKPGLARSKGGVTESVLGRAACPVAVVPVGGP